jgi:hypothetical protein
VTLNNRPENRAVYHHFLALNLSVSVSFGVFYPEFFILSGTGLDYTSFQVSRNELEGNKFQVSWEPFSYGNQSGNDISCRQSFFQKQNQFLILP